MKTVYLAWQNTFVDRAWYPIGRLDADVQAHQYRFGYTQGAKEAEERAGFAPLLAFPDFSRVYQSTELFPLFKNRVLNESRPDFNEYLQQLDLSPERADALEILAVSGGTRETDNLEVFPKLLTRRDGSFHCRFFLHGWRHLNEASVKRVDELRADEPLRVCVELNNPKTGLAIQLQTDDDYYMIGWAPKYLIKDLAHAISEAALEIHAHVVRINTPPAPLKQRVLIELEGKLPVGYEPMSSPEFNYLVS